MNPIKLNIIGDIFDGYLYSGYLFVVMNDGVFGKISMEKLITKKFAQDSDTFRILYLSFIHSDWIANKQGEMILSISMMNDSWKNFWNKQSGTPSIDINISYDDLDIIGNADDMPILDIKAYNMRIYLGGRKGVMEGRILQENNGLKLDVSEIKKVSDIRTNSINAKFGSILISSQKEGLFFGNLWQNQGDLRVQEKPIKETSYRTGWIGYDVLNYESKSSLSYIQNKHVHDKEGKYKHNQSSDDRERKMIIEEFGNTIHEFSSLKLTNIDIDNILYTFNYKDSEYFLLSDGTIDKRKFNTFGDNNENIEFKTRGTIIQNYNYSELLPQKILSTNVINLKNKIGYVIEYSNYTDILIDGEIYKIDIPATSVRTYPNSIRYKNVISIFHDEGALLCAFPNF